MQANELSSILIRVFGGWDQASLDLLEDAGIVHDHLADHLPRKVVSSISKDIWERAWSDFEAYIDHSSDRPAEEPA